MNEIMNSDWVITIFGGIISTVVGGMISKALEENSTTQYRNYSMSPIAFWSFVFVFEVVWTAATINLIYPMFAGTHVFGEGFGLLIAAGLWIAGAVQMPRIVSQIN